MKNIPLVECWNFVGATPQKFDGEKRYISTGALDKDHINEADVEMVTFDNRPSRANLEVNSGDILFAKMASTEKTFVVDSISQNDIYSTGFCAVRANESKILSKCLYYFLSSSLFLEQKDKNSSGATQKAITNAGLSKIYINLPELAEQQEFIEQMDSLTFLIIARREQLAKLDELVKSRFIELFGNMTHNTHGWDTHLLDECFEITSSKRILKSEWKDKGIPFLRVRDMVQLATTGKLDNEFFVSEEFYGSLSDSDGVPKQGDILMSATSTLGKCHVVSSGERFYFKDADVLRFRAKKAINPVFFMEQMKTEYIEEQIARTLGITTVAHFTIKAAKTINIRLPNIELQEQFAAFVEQTDKSKLAVQQSLEKLEILKNSLIQEYFG